jgi:hypothetical protein
MEMCNYIGKHVSYQIACLPALFTINSLYAPAASLSLSLSRECGARTHSHLHSRGIILPTVLFIRSCTHSHIKSSVIIFDRVNASIVTLFLCKFRNYMHNAFNNGGEPLRLAHFSRRNA